MRTSPPSRRLSRRFIHTTSAVHHSYLHSFFIGHSASIPGGEYLEWALDPPRSIFAQFLAPDSIFWIGAPSNWKGDAAHPAPRRAIFVTIRGEYQVTTSDGVVRLPAGSVLLVKNTTGEGHSTKITSDEDCFILGVGLPTASAA